MKIHRFYSFVQMALVALFLPSHVAAIELSHGDLSHSDYRLSLEKGGFIKGETGWLALELMPGEGWHTYWKNPGDSGAAPIFSWKTPEGITIGKPAFPVPDFIPVGPLMNYGYDGPSTLLFPLHVDAAFSGSIASISVAAEWLVCKVECVPQIADWHFNVSEQKADAIVAPSAALFLAARSKFPEAAYWDSNLTISNNNSQLIVFSDVSDVDEVIQASFIPEADGVLEYAAAQTWEWTPHGLTLGFTREAQKAPDNGKGILRLLFVNGSVSAFELEPALKLNIRETSETQAKSLASTMPIWQASLFALLGGLILNLMPCVFPVLSLKAFALVSANYKSLSERRMEGWAYTLGIWASFMLIVGVLVALRASGEAVGWGFQLQEPLFVGLLAILMVIVSLSLAGMFHLEFSFQGAGQSLAMKEGYAGSFFKGVLATLVATPCTAPLMAPAIGFAITQSLPVIILVFSLLAFGLALPFLALSYSDRLAKMMPRPGAWMEKVKQGLAFPMLLTAAWLIYVYDTQAGSRATFFLLAGIILLSFGLWLWSQTSHKGGRLVALAALVASLIVVVNVSVTQDTVKELAREDEQAYSGARLKGLLSEGKPVFVYFSAEWCITCKVNERVALHTDGVQKLIAEKAITVLKGDWTNRNAEIAAVLAKYGRAGVPLYLFFPEGQKTALVLPEILTEETVKTYLLR